jgi:hypothetical protein
MSDEFVFMGTTYISFCEDCELKIKSSADRGVGPCPSTIDADKWTEHANGEIPDDESLECVWAKFWNNQLLEEY